MGYLKDLGTGLVDHIDEATGLPMDEYGHYLDPTDQDTGERIENIQPGDELYNLTSPYGHLEFAIGSGDDFYCFDYRTVNTKQGEMIVLHSVINSETGGFIQDGEYWIVPPKGAINILEGMVDSAIEWCGENEIRHSKSGWNQDPWYVFRALATDLHKAPFKVSQRMCRYGTKRLDAWIDTL